MAKLELGLSRSLISINKILHEQANKAPLLNFKRAQLLKMSLNILKSNTRRFWHDVSSVGVFAYAFYLHSGKI